jgi:adenylate kinase family enzyme
VSCIAILGGPCSGKTTVVDSIVEHRGHRVIAKYGADPLADPSDIISEIVATMSLMPKGSLLLCDGVPQDRDTLSAMVATLQAALAGAIYLRCDHRTLEQRQFVTRRVSAEEASLAILWWTQELQPVRQALRDMGLLRVVDADCSTEMLVRRCESLLFQE